ncbi:MAG: peptide-binding protein [Deltaproteobacteria bacterium]|nr:peptide-binding protein [Deltaproteobacteria bacterium]
MAKALLVILSGIFGCAQGESVPPVVHSPAPAYGDTILTGSIGDASNLLPMLASDSASFDIASLVYNGLVKYDKNLELTGDLAERWEVSLDQLTIRFYLRKGVKWHDGVEFTAEDILFGYQKLIDPHTLTAYSEDYKQVKAARVIDRYTFEVTYKRPFAPALASWGMLPIIPKHLLEGKEINQSELSRHPIGTGPYRFKRWVTNDHIWLTSSPDYFEGRPYIDGYIYRIIPDQATMFLELRTQGIDWMGLTPLQYQRQTDTAWFKKEFNKYSYIGAGYTYLGYNLRDKRFQDKRVRQAISYAIDKNKVVRGVLHGLGVAATGPYKPDTWAYNPNVKPYPYDPEKAKQLLAEAGWKDTDHDEILDKEGQPFEFVIMTNQGNAQRQLTLEIIQRELRKLGILVKPRVVEWSTFINEFIDKRNFEAIILGWSLSPDPDQFDIWHSSKTGLREFNFISYNNPEVDELLEKGRSVFDPKERKKYYDRLQEILAEEQPYTFLYVPYALPAIHRRFYGVEPAPAGISHNFHKWYVPAELQRRTHLNQMAP